MLQDGVYTQAAISSQYPDISSVVRKGTWQRLPHYSEAISRIHHKFVPLEEECLSFQHDTHRLQTRRYRKY